ncbi:MAG: peroxiredoxin family protein [Limisphaerales bacterium]
MNKHTILFVALMACLAPVSSFADNLGDPAPHLTVKEWIKGNPVQIKAGTNVYVLVFCTLSRVNDFALTNLSNLQKKYRDKGLVAVAVSDEPAESLKPFVQLKGAEIEFAVAVDDDARKATGTYQQAFNQRMLPRAYVVGKDGNVLWYGHPLRGLDGVVDDIMSGRYKFEPAQKSVIAAEQMEKYLVLAHQDDTNVALAGRMLLSIRTNDAPGLCDLAYQIATDPFIVKRDVALASAALDRAEQLAPTNTTDIAVDRAILLFQTGREEEGLARARQALASAQSLEAKDEAQTCVRAMEARLAAAKTNQNKAAEGKP